MERFVDECRKEWSRLGVPSAVANEMAADLEADLAEAQAEGASPEAVLGNGFFDAKSFAASWATAKGVVSPSNRLGETPRWPRWAMVASVALSLVVMLAGLGILGSRRQAAVARVSLGPVFSTPFRGPRGAFVGPNMPVPVISSHGAAFAVLGLILVVAGLVGLAFTLWRWKPWSTLRRRGGFDESVGLPSYL